MHETEADTARRDMRMRFEWRDRNSLQIVVRKVVWAARHCIKLNFKFIERGSVQVCLWQIQTERAHGYIFPHYPGIQTFLAKHVRHQQEPQIIVQCQVKKALGRGSHLAGTILVPCLKFTWKDLHSFAFIIYFTDCIFIQITNC